MIDMCRFTVLLRLLSLCFLLTVGSAFHHGPLGRRSCELRDGSRFRRWPQSERDSDEKTNAVEIGGKEYLKGFISSPIQDDTARERGNGLEQALKLGGLTTAFLVVLVVCFMASNGLI